MTEEQKGEFDETLAYVRGVRDVMELHERRIRDCGEEVKADPADPYSINAEDVADALSLARDNLTDIMELLSTFG